MVKKDYVVINDKTTLGLANQVIRYLEKGWKCQGGVGVESGETYGRQTHFYQAMVKE
jgi:hypothetical protein